MREDECLYADIPSNGGTLGYRLLKGLQLPIDYPADKLVALATQFGHDLAVVSLLPSFLFFPLVSAANNSAVELIEQYIHYQRLAESFKQSSNDYRAKLGVAQARANKLQLDPTAKKAFKANTDTELVDLRMKAHKLEEAKNKWDKLELVLYC